MKDPFHRLANNDGRLKIGDVGEGTKIWAFASVQEGAVIGKDCVIGQGAHIGKHVRVGDGCKIQNGAQLFEGVHLDEDVFIGPHVVFTNVLTPRAFQKAPGFKTTTIERGASIGANATILCGIKIGEYAMIGAGSVVTEDVAPHALVVGVPARFVRSVCCCGDAIPRNYYASWTCPVCKKSFIHDRGTSKLAVTDAT